MSTLRLPATMQQWMADVARRLRRLERHNHPPPEMLRPPGWTITTDTSGNLVARPNGGGADVILATPP